MNDNFRWYTGTRLNELKKNLTYRAHSDLGSNIQQADPILSEDIPPYYPSKELVDAVHYARILNRPLLLRGEPGCGKTRLAQAVAFEMYGEDYRQHYFEWYIKSKTEVNDGLYSYDHLARLRDVEAQQEQDKRTYRSFGPLGKAFIQSTQAQPSILLIDEIDKADLDFPNDLLLELDQKRFFIKETGEEIVAQHAPIIFITSNDEKELPNAFLRRCVFHYIEFPGYALLLKIARGIVQAHNQEFGRVFPDEVVKDIVKRFEDLYRKMKADPNTEKLPSTSELIDWLRVLHYYFVKGELDLSDGVLPDGQLLFPEVLLKSVADRKTNTKIN